MARKIKVLHLVSILDKVGGLEKLVAQIVTHLDKDHYEAEIWAIARAGSYAQHLQAQGIKVKDLGISNYYLPWNTKGNKAIIRLCLMDFFMLR